MNLFVVSVFTNSPGQLMSSVIGLKETFDDFGDGAGVPRKAHDGFGHTMASVMEREARGKHLMVMARGQEILETRLRFLQNRTCLSIQN